MRDLQSLDSVFEKKIFRIPDYQRGYAWGEKQLKDFWEDLISLPANRLHYTGVLSIKAVPPEDWKCWSDEKWLIEGKKFVPYYVVDGQQRITTISIFIQCLVEVVEALPDHAGKNSDAILLGCFSIKELKQTYIAEVQPPHFIAKAYKFGYESDNPSFQFMRYRIFNEPNPGHLQETFYTLNLENAKVFFLENLRRYNEQRGLPGLEELFTKVTQRLMFNLHDIGDDFDVFVAFETMNNRGKKLSDLELLKNRLIYLSTLYNDNELSSDEKAILRSDINDAWANVYHQLGRNKQQPLNDDEFLRAHWIMYFKYSRQKGNDYIHYLLDEQFEPKRVMPRVEFVTAGFDEIVDYDDGDIEDESDSEPEPIEHIQQIDRLPVEEISKYVGSLKSAALHWYNQHFPENSTELTDDEKIALDRLNRLGPAYFRPLIMATFMNPSLDANQRVQLFHAIERFIFLNFRFARALSSYQSSVFYNQSRELYFARTTVEGVIQQLDKSTAWVFESGNRLKTNGFKEHIERHFDNGGGYYNWNAIKYFLYEYEEDIRQTRGQAKINWKNFIRNKSDSVSIEHIYPQTPANTYWSERFNSPEDWKRGFQCGSLGNLLPLSSSINSSLQNDAFPDKKATKVVDGQTVRNGYSNGSYSELEVAHSDDWTPEHIKARGLKLLDFFERRWNVSLGNEDDKVSLLFLDFEDEDE